MYYGLFLFYFFRNFSFTFFGGERGRHSHNTERKGGTFCISGKRVLQVNSNFFRPPLPVFFSEFAASLLLK